MSETVLEGKVSFVHHDKHYVTIDYTHKNKQKSINGKVDDARQLKLIEQKLIKKIHQFHEGDEVYFVLTLSGRGDKMVAEQIRYRFNNTLGNLVNRALTNNRFTGYLKLADDKYFIKETGSYQFFPLHLSPWEKPPAANTLNEPVQFQLGNLDKPEKLYALLFRQFFIPEFITAQKHFAAKTPVAATIEKITQHGIYLGLFGNKIKAKIAGDSVLANPPKEGDIINVVISHLTADKIVVKPV